MFGLGSSRKGMEDNDTFVNIVERFFNLVMKQKKKKRKKKKDDKQEVDLLSDKSLNAPEEGRPTVLATKHI